MKTLAIIRRSHRQLTWLCAGLLLQAYGERCANAQDSVLQLPPPQFESPALQNIAPVLGPPPTDGATVKPVEISDETQPVQMQEYHHYTGPGSTSSYAAPVQYDPSVPEEHEPGIYKMTEGFLEALSKPAHPISKRLAKALHSEHHEPHTELDSHAIGIQPTPRRPDLVLQWNEEFLAPGFLEQGICTPTVQSGDRRFGCLVRTARE